MRILSADILNILSIHEMSISFPKNGLLLIDGWNKDTNSANGAGKSSIFHAIAWGLYGEYPRGVSITDFIRQNTKSSKISIKMEIPNVGLVYIVRARPKFFSASVDGNEITEEEFKKILPIDYGQFMIAQYFAQSLNQRFLDLNDSSRKDLLLKIMSADSFASYKSKIDLDLKTINNEKSTINDSLNNLNGKISAFEDSLEDTVSLKKKIEEIDTIHSKYLKELNSIDISNPPEDMSKYLDLIEKLNQKINSISSLKGSVSTYRKLLKELDSTSEPVDSFDGNCPVCNTNLDLIDGDLVPHDSSSFSKKLEKHRHQVQEKRISILDNIRTMEIEISKEDNILETLRKLKEKINALKLKHEDANSRSNDLKLFLSKLENDKSTILNKLSQQDKIIAKIQEAKQIKQKYSSMLDDLSNRYQILETSSYVMSPVGVPAYIMDSILSSINDKVRELLQYIWPNSSYELLSFRENKSGNVSPKMSDILIIDGNKRPIGSLSGGERRCLSLAIDFAIAEVISSYTRAELNPLILDEPFDHLDSSNRARVIDFLREMATRRCIVVIDHASEAKALFDNIITIIKQNGISTVQKDGTFC